MLRTIELPEEMWKEGEAKLGFIANDVQADDAGHIFVANMATDMRGTGARSEERRVGKECRSRWSPYH